MKIGIIAAEEKEVSSVKGIMENIVENKICNMDFFEGKIEKIGCILVKCGVRKSK